MAVKPNSKYWQERALDRFLEDEKKGSLYIKRINNAYNRANRNIQREINEIYRVYSKGTGLDKQTLKELLTKSETDKFWKTAEGKGYKGFVKNNYKARITRLEKLQFQLYDHVKQVGILDVNEQGKLYQETLKNNYNKTMYDTAKGSGFDFSFNKLDERTINKIMDNKWSGKNFSQRIWTNTDILGDKLSDILGGAVASGQSLEKTARQLRDSMNVGKYYSERLVRTEMNYFHNEAEYEAYKEMGVEKYEFVATLDMKTSNVCQELDGAILSLDNKKNGNNWPPLHPNCRSTTVAYFGDEYRSLERRARNPITGKSEMVENVSYKDWLVNQQARYGKQRINVQQKKTQNLTNDTKQHEKYKLIYGNKIPPKVADFQELKYNKINDWEILKADKQRVLNSLDYRDSFFGKFSDYETRAWYKSHDVIIPDRINNIDGLESKARKAHELRNQYRSQARDMMLDQEKRKDYDIKHPNTTFKQLLEYKQLKYGLVGDEAYQDIIRSSTTTNAKYDKKAGIGERR